MKRLALSLSVTAALLTPSALQANNHEARAELKDASGKTIGEARFESAEGSTTVTLTATGLAPGKHGFHIHGTGKCVAPDFKSAGGHFNPTAKQHGAKNPKGPHYGDMPNLEANEKGEAKATVKLMGVSLTAGDYTLFDADGAAIVIHAKEDDLKSDPAGNAGDRIACGVIAIVKK